MKFEHVAGILTLITALLGVLTAFTHQYIPVAIAGVVAGVWWAFGKKFLPSVHASPKDTASR